MLWTCFKLRFLTNLILGCVPRRLALRYLRIIGQDRPPHLLSSPISSAMVQNGDLVSNRVDFWLHNGHLLSTRLRLPAHRYELGCNDNGRSLSQQTEPIYRNGRRKYCLRPGTIHPPNPNGYAAADPKTTEVWIARDILHWVLDRRHFCCSCFYSAVAFD